MASYTTGGGRRPVEHFRIGSFTKAFTGTLILQLAAEGKLTLDDTVATWLPGGVEEQLGVDGAEIAVRRLLTTPAGSPTPSSARRCRPPKRPAGASSTPRSTTPSRE